jgi:hypothetical protein
MRVFAGPNGSGKSELKSVLPTTLLGEYLNPDEIEARIRELGFLDFGVFGVKTTEAEVLGGFTGSAFLRSEGLGDAAGRLEYDEGRLVFGEVETNAYFASVAEITEGATLELKTNRIPAWFKRAVLDKIT